MRITLTRLLVRFNQLISWCFLSGFIVPWFSRLKALPVNVSMNGKHQTVEKLRWSEGFTNLLQLLWLFGELTPARKPRASKKSHTLRRVEHIIHASGSTEMVRFVEWSFRNPKHSTLIHLQVPVESGHRCFPYDPCSLEVRYQYFLSPVNPFPGGKTTSCCIF